MNFLQRLGQQLATIWKGMGLARRIAFVVLSAILLCALVAIGVWSSQSDYRVLFSGMTAEEAGAVTTQLQSQGIPYRLQQQTAGTSIFVPAERLVDTRVKLAADGLPVKSGKGFELFDQSPLGMTPFTQHVNYLRALQGELAKTIMQIDPVTAARVHIVLPEQSPFVRERKPPTASVVLQLRPGTTLSRSTASGITALVARSVEGLSSEQVTLMDTEGHVLTENQNEEAGLVSTQLDYRRSLEKYLASKAEDMLSRVLGPGRAIVRVAADINFHRMKERKESYNPDGRVATSEKTVSTKSTNSNAAPKSGVAGATANLPGRLNTATSPGGPNTSSNTVEETTETAFAVSKVTQEVEDKLGNVERLTIAAMVELKNPKSDGHGAAMSLADAQELIKQAVGFKSDRDLIKVSDVRLTGGGPPPEPPPESEQMKQWQYVLDIVRNGSFAIASLVGLTLGFMLLRGGRSAKAAPAVEETKPTDDLQLRLDRLATVAAQNPEVLVRVLSNWVQNPEKSTSIK